MIKKNKLTKTICALTAVIMLLSCTTIFASAAINNTDASYSYAFSANSKYTVGRLKKDDSSCYMYYQSGSLTYTASAYGRTSAYSATYDCSGGYMYRFTSAHQARFMYNYVYENGYDFLAIKGQCLGSGTCKGVWSPDSLYESSVLPPSDYIQ